MHNYLTAIILGIIEGITEFLPISSTGHLIIAGHWLGFTGSFANMFDVIIQLGAIISVIVYFHRTLIPPRQNMTEQKRVLMLWRKTLTALIPAVLIGAILGQFLEELLFNIPVVATALIVGGVILIIVDKKDGGGPINNVADVSYKNALKIGLIQCLAMIPGTSRSAATIIGAMLLGCNRRTAAEFSFFLAIPTMLAAAGYTFLKNDGLAMTGSEWLTLSLGFIVAFVVAWIVIAWLMKYLRHHDFRIFGWYRIALGLALLGMLFLIR
jgi:undecaprenyl-diphosphatase